MKKHSLPTAVTLILLIFIATHLSAEIDDVLSVIPDDAIGVVYVHSLLGLNDEINTLLADMIPSEPPQEVIAWILAEAFGAGFESLKELEELGFDLSKNFAVFLTSMNPPSPAAAVHVKDPERVMQLIEAEEEGSSEISYNGMTYYTTGEEGGFVLLDDVMVYSGSEQVCKKAIDIYKKTATPIAKNPDYASLKLDTTSGVNDLVFYFKMEEVVEALGPMLAKGADEMKSRMEQESATNPQLQSGLEMAHKLIDKVMWLSDQAKTLSLTIQLNGSDLQISPFMKFKNDSEIQEHIQVTSTDLTQLKYLPQNAFLNGVMRLQKETMINLTQGMMKLFIPSDPNADKEKVEKATQELTKMTTNFLDGLGDETAVSVDFSDSVMPDVLYIFDVTNEGKIKGFMEEEYLTYLKTSMAMFEAMGAPPESSGMYSDASAGPSEMYNGVEIKSYILPNITSLFAQLPQQMEAVAPKQWNVYYAITDGKLLYSMASNAQPVRDALDRINGRSAGFDQGEGYDKLTSALTLRNSMFFALSPITAVKNLVQVFALVDPNVGMLQMLLMNIPETYSIGVASQNRDGGVEGKLFISLGDFKELINMAVSMQGM